MLIADRVRHFVKERAGQGLFRLGRDEESKIAAALKYIDDSVKHKRERERESQEIRSRP